MFILDTMSGIPIAELREKYRRYSEYLESVRDQLPPAAYEYATAPWHYDIGLHDPRCPHDSWVDSVLIAERASPDNLQDRSLGITVQLLNPFHNGHIEFRYEEVESYSMEMPPTSSSRMPEAVNRGHHDWLIDEIRLSPAGRVVHEVVLALGSHWLIECKEFSYSFLPVA